MAWPFKKADPEIEEIPEEIQDYQEAERKERAGVAWMLAFATLIFTLIIASGAFYGGRYFYRRSKKNNQPEVVVQTPAAPAQNPETAALAQTPEAAPPASTPEQDSTPTPAQPSAQTPDQSLAPAQTPSQTAQTPAVSGSTTALPSTGPANLIGVFVATALISGVAYNFVANRRTN